MNQEYTIVIRTLGKAGEKYQALLDSINAQTIRPAQVLVFLPEGYALPPERLGNEKFVFCKKGMVSQRVAAFSQVQTTYTLALDDDVSFEPIFVEELFRTMEKCDADFVSPIVRDIAPTNNAPSRFKKMLFGMKEWLLGVSMRRNFKEDYLVKIWRTGGFLVKKNTKPNVQYYNQSGHGTCIFGKTYALKKLHLEKELWLEDTRYALPDDMVTFYKLYLQGNVIAMNSEVKFYHLDAGSSMIDENRIQQTIYASARNGVIFWHRFIYKKMPNRLLSVLCLCRRLFFTSLFSLLKSIAKRNFIYFNSYMGGYVSAFRFIKSDAYKNLPRV